MTRQPSRSERARVREARVREAEDAGSRLRAARSGSGRLRAEPALGALLTRVDPVLYAWLGVKTESHRCLSYFRIGQAPLGGCGHGALVPRGV